MMASRKGVSGTGRKLEAGGGSLPFGSPKPMSDGGQKTSLVQRVYETIMASLDSGAIAPGSRIIAAELAQQLGVSRAPVREALGVLAGQGLVELLPDRGAILRLMNANDLVQIYEVSAPVAAVGLRAAAGRIGEGENAARVTAAMAAIREAGDSPDPGIGFYLVLNDFHYLLNLIGEKPYVTSVLRSINIEYWNRLLVATIDLRQHAAHYVRNYQRIADAVLDGDGRSAGEIMRYHADWCITLLKISMIRDQGSSTIDHK